MRDRATNVKDIQDGDWLSKTVPQVAKVIGVSDRTAWRLVHSGALPSLKIGRCRVVRRIDAIAYLDRLAEEQGLAERVSAAA